MPFESSLPLAVACLLNAAACSFLWLRAQGRGLLVGAALLAMAGLGAFAADALVVTESGPWPASSAMNGPRA